MTCATRGRLGKRVDLVAMRNMVNGMREEEQEHTREVKKRLHWISKVH